MSKRKLITNSVALALVAFGATNLVGCNPGTSDNPSEEKVYFSFSVGMKSGASIISLSSTNESVQVFDNGIDTAGRTYTFESTNPKVATIDENGKITPKSTGTVNFRVTETKSDETKALKKSILIVEDAEKFTGGQNYSGGTTTEELNKRAEILGKLEKYAMDTHLTGITLFDNGGLVRYSDRVELPTDGEYIQGYGFGLLAEGKLNGTLPGDEGKKNPTFLHESIAQDSLKINQYSATGSQVSDLASYITSTYWGTKLEGKTSYVWYPCLAADEVQAPKFNEKGEMTGYSEKKVNDAPIPMEYSATQLYKKWRIYVKTDGVNGANLKYTTASSKLQGQGFNNRGITIDDYEFAYKLLLTGSNNIIRGTEMANDSSYGIKGAQRYFNETKSMTSKEEINKKWEEFTKVDANGNSKLGIQKGHDDTNNLDYLDIELINPIDEFTAMYTLSSSLTSPLPEDLFMGEKAIKSTMKDSIKIYGTFNNENDDAILDYTLCVGPFTLTNWKKNSEIIFTRNDNWFEVGERYHIPGIDYRVIDTSTDTEKNWKQLEAGNLDSAGVPSKKTQEWRGKPGVYETKGDSTFKLNVNSMTQKQWDETFGPQGKWPANQTWDIKPWMSNQDFLDGLFYSIDRNQFAEKRGVVPSTNYFSDAYQMRNKDGGKSYNEYQAHKDAVAGYAENFGYNYDKAVDCFRNAVQQLSKEGKIVLGKSKADPTTITIHIRWMYQTDIKEYGEDIKSYFETAFNDDAVCGGKVKLKVEQDAVTNWEDVYNVWMMQGCFDLGFGAISGNTYNPLNFMEVLKSDNSSSFTLNWGPDTSEIDEKNPIIYDGQKWSFDALWEVADHGGIVENGKKIEPVNLCAADRPTKLEGGGIQRNMYEGFKLKLKVDFAESNVEGKKAEFDVNRFDIYVAGRGNITLAEKGDGNIVYDRDNHQVIITVTEEKAQEVNAAIKEQNGFKDTDKDEWHKNPFIESRLNYEYAYEFYYELSINGGAPSINYHAVDLLDE